MAASASPADAPWPHTLANRGPCKQDTSFSSVCLPCGSRAQCRTAASTHTHIHMGVCTTHKCVQQQQQQHSFTELPSHQYSPTCHDLTAHTWPHKQKHTGLPPPPPQTHTHNTLQLSYGPSQVSWIACCSSSGAPPPPPGGGPPPPPGGGAAHLQSQYQTNPLADHGTKGTHGCHTAAVKLNESGRSTNTHQR